MPTNRDNVDLKMEYPLSSESMIASIGRAVAQLRIVDQPSRDPVVQASEGSVVFSYLSNDSSRDTETVAVPSGR